MGLSPANLDLLQEVAGLLEQLEGPWLIGGDFNRTPELLQESGWLQLVRGSSIGRSCRRAMGRSMTSLCPLVAWPRRWLA